MGETFRNLPKDDDDDVKDNVNVIRRVSHILFDFFIVWSLGETKTKRNKKVSFFPFVGLKKTYDRVEHL